MAQFDVYDLPDGSTVVSVQSDFLSHYSTTLVIPLLSSDEMPTERSRLHPHLVIDGASHVLATQLTSAVPSRLLRRPRTSIVDHEYAIKAAIDMLVSGF